MTVSISDVSLCNQALAKVNGKRITSLTDSSESARKCNEVFYDLLEQDLVYTHWNFATKRVALAQLTDAPPFGWTYQYQLPTDYLEMVKEYNEAEYKIEGKRLLSNEGTIQIVYIYGVTDMSLLSAAFRKAFVFRLAAHLAMPIANSKDMAMKYEDLAEKYMSRAAAKDGQADTPDDRSDGDWVTDR